MRTGLLTYPHKKSLLTCQLACLQARAQIRVGNASSSARMCRTHLAFERSYVLTSVDALSPSAQAYNTIRSYARTLHSGTYKQTIAHAYVQQTRYITSRRITPNASKRELSTKNAHTCLHSDQISFPTHLRALVSLDTLQHCKRHVRAAHCAQCTSETAYTGLIAC